MFTNSHSRVRKRLVPDYYKVVPRYGSSFIEKTPDSGDYVRFSDGFYITPEQYARAEITADENHGRAPYRVGGPFENFKIVNAYPMGLVGVGSHVTPLANFTVTPFGHGRIKYVGGHTVYLGDWPGVDFDTNWLFRSANVFPAMTTWKDYYTPSTSGLESEVWAKSMPRLEQGGLGVALAEARDVPRMLQTSAHGFVDIYKRVGGDASSKFLSPKKAADHFLNHSFGWVPFINDLSKFIDNVFGGAASIDKLIHNNGTWTHVKRTLLNSSTSEVVYENSNGSMYYPANTMINSMDSPPSYQIRKEVQRHSYGVGRFRYYQPYLDMQTPEAQSVLGPLRRQLLLHGARLSPATIYRATKWTWLADWVSSSGSIVDTLNAMVLDDMVAKYLYLCDTNTTKVTLEQNHPWNSRCDAPESLSCVRWYATKTRKEASPFGFSLAWDNLSPKQLAILAALGVSRR
jgi:hypothetical protein